MATPYAYISHPPLTIKPRLSRIRQSEPPWPDQLIVRGRGLADSVYYAYRRAGYQRLKLDKNDIGWQDRIFLRFHNDANFNSDFQEYWWYPPEGDYVLKAVPYKYIDWPPRKFWFLDHFILTDYETFEKYIAEGADWIIVGTYIVADTCGRWISVGNMFHKTAAWGAVISSLICFLYPNKRWLYWPFQLASTFSVIGYFHYMKDPINKYQVEWNKAELSRFPMRLFFATPLVFRKTPNIRRRICHRILSICGLAYAMYYLPRYPPCGCMIGADTPRHILPFKR